MRTVQVLYIEVRSGLLATSSNYVHHLPLAVCIDRVKYDDPQLAVKMKIFGFGVLLEPSPVILQKIEFCKLRKYFSSEGT